MRAVNKIYFPFSELSFRSKITGSEESINQDLNFIQYYFEKSKWIFVMENIHYQNYMGQINQTINQFIRDLRVDFALYFLLSLVQYSSEQLLFLVRFHWLTILLEGSRSMLINTGSNIRYRLFQFQASWANLGTVPIPLRTFTFFEPVSFPSQLLKSSSQVAKWISIFRRSALQIVT